MTRRGRRRRNEVIKDHLDDESSDEDIGDSDSVYVSWCDRESDEIDDNDIKIWKEEMGFSIYNERKEMTSYKYSGFQIMVTNDDHAPRNHFFIDRFISGNKLLPPPPRHFRYGKKECIGLCFYRPLVHKNDPPPPASLLRLSEMSAKKLKAIASENDLRGWEDLSKTDLVRFLVKHRYIFSDDFYKQRSLPNTLTKAGYYNPTNQCKCELEYYCWWKGLSLANDYEKRLFLSEPN